MAHGCERKVDTKHDIHKRILLRLRVSNRQQRVRQWGWWRHAHLRIESTVCFHSSSLSYSDSIAYHHTPSCVLQRPHTCTVDSERHLHGQSCWVQGHQSMGIALPHRCQVQSRCTTHAQCTGGTHSQRRQARRCTLRHSWPRSAVISTCFQAERSPGPVVYSGQCKSLVAAHKIAAEATVGERPSEREL
jgi:hypothetical protein